jgi:hypothetical protein
MPLSEAEILASAVIADADRAAEAAAAASREGTPSVSVPAPSSSTSAASALDQVFEEVSKTAPVDTGDPLGLENGGVPRPVEGAPKEPAAAPAPTPAPTPALTPAPSTEPAAPKTLLESVVQDGLKPTEPKPADPKPTDDPYAHVQLRSDAAPKTKETFAELKRLAHEREQAARQEAQAAAARTQELEKQLGEVQARLKEFEGRQVTPEIDAELKELRAFRAQFDTEHDPEFRSRFDSRIDQNYEAIYGQLRAHGLPDSEVQKLREFDRETRDQNIEGFLEKLPATSRRLIEAKLGDNISVSEDRRRALAEARQKADHLLAERAQAPLKAQEQRDAEVAEALKPALQALPWMHVKHVPATATTAEREALEAHNKYAQEMQRMLGQAIADDSPKTRAEAALAVPVAHYYLRVAKELSAQVEALKKELDDIQQASATSRTARSTATARADAAKPAPSVNSDPGDALDAAFREATGAAR